MIDVSTGRLVAEVALLNLREPYLRFNCKWHDACVVVLPAGRDYVNKVMALYRWVAAGRFIGTREAHLGEALKLKRRFGIKSRAAVRAG